MYWLIALRPQYVELNPPLLEPMFGLDYTERSIVNWKGGGTYYLWRQEASCRKSECGSRDEILDFYNVWLEVEGWTHRIIDGGCSIILPEIQLLDDDVGIYEVYRPSHIKEWNSPPSLCLTVYTSSDDANYWHIVIGTSNPSFITRIYQGLD